MVKPDDMMQGVIETVVSQQRVQSQKIRPYLTVTQYMGLNDIMICFLNKKPIEKITLCKVKCKTAKFTVHFFDKTATIVSGDARLYPDGR